MGLTTGVQNFSTIINAIDFVSNAESMSKAKATEAAHELVTLYDQASKDIPRISDKEHAAAKKALGL